MSFRSVLRSSISSISGTRRSLSLTATAREPAGGSDDRGEGSTARSSGFSKREKAAEEQYIHEREKEAYKKALAAVKAQREKLEASGVNISELEKEHK